ncbi:MAG TPA: hypothetical protein VJV23_03160 [Candidatus Polarisedimenticolia bacterium]|nr:hypothetical protein [Candidatus Polarisedimenticolia bacterium]
MTLATASLAAALALAAAEAPPARASLEESLRRAEGAMREGAFAEAADAWMEAARMVPNHPGVLIRAGEALALSGRPAEGLEYLLRAGRQGGTGHLERIETSFASAGRADLTAALDLLRANAGALATGTVAFSLAEKDLIPESVAYDPREKVFYVGSLHKRKIVRVDASGDARDFVPQAGSGLWSVLGIKVDQERREIWANACNLVDPDPPMVPDEAATRGRTAVFRFDLATGKVVARYESGSKESPLCFNDLTPATEGAWYLSSGADGIFRVDPGKGTLERFAAYDGMVNGIAASDDGRLLFLADHRRGVQVMDVASRQVRALRLPPDASLAGVDGLYVRGRTVVAVQNALTRGLARVVSAEMDPGLESVLCLRVLDRNRPEFDVPTTGVLVGGDLYYVASSQLDSFDHGTIWPLDRLRQSVVIRTPYAPRCGEQGA